MNSLLAPGLHPFSPHFSPQKSGKPETFSVNRQKLWRRKTERILSVDTFKETGYLGDLSERGFSLSAVIRQLIMEDDDRLGLRLVIKDAATASQSN